MNGLILPIGGVASGKGMCMQPVQQASSYFFERNKPQQFSEFFFCCCIFWIFFKITLGIKKMIPVGHFPKVEGGGSNPNPKVLGYLMGLSFGQYLQGGEWLNTFNKFWSSFQVVLGQFVLTIVTEHNKWFQTGKKCMGAFFISKNDTKSPFCAQRAKKPWLKTKALRRS